MIGITISSLHDVYRTAVKEPSICTAAVRPVPPNPSPNHDYWPASVSIVLRLWYMVTIRRGVLLLQRIPEAFTHAE